MKKIYYGILCGIMLSHVGCDKSTSGGPGATSPTSQKSIVGQTDDTFSLDIPSHNIMQGESNTLTIDIDRGTNFGDEVTLKLGELPKGLSIKPAGAVIKPGDKETILQVQAARDAALGDFTVKVMGNPAKGAAAESELQISISEHVPGATAANAGVNARAKWDEYVAAMQLQMDQYSAKYNDLKNRAASAEGQTKTDLDARVEVAKVKMDYASERFNELKSASEDRWEKVKVGVGNAFDDLQTIFE